MFLGEKWVHGGFDSAGLMTALNLGGLFQPKQFYNSVFPTEKGNSKPRKATSKWEFSLCDVMHFVGRGITRVSVEKKNNLRALPT